jgi:hypothetical protein
MSERSCSLLKAVSVLRPYKPSALSKLMAMQESFSHIMTVKPKGNYKEDIALLPATLPSPKTPASFAYRLDSKEMGKYEWMMVTFVPDDAGVCSSCAVPINS